MTRLKAKMQEYIDNGVRLGWLIDRQNRTVCIYRPHREPEVLENPDRVSDDPELPGLGLPMAKIW
ncbi:MAG: Uma2 family endonuclease [Geitlerinemataceae cyanobacterium]